MNLFEQTIQKVVQYNKNYSSLRTVVEKEIMHHDILRAMNNEGYLKNLTFIGGTCLRLCYGSQRLSEDLDFSSSFNFNKKELSSLPKILQETFLKKYNFKVEVSEPVKETGDTNTWKIKIITRQEKKNLPVQRINLDIVLLPSYNKQPVMLKNYYGINSGTSGLILFAESLEEILVDKIIAVAFRLNRVKNRDLWDIFWLYRKNIELNKELLKQKLSDRKIEYKDFSYKYNKRINEIENLQKIFLDEMKRFLAPTAFDSTFTSKLWWQQLLLVLKNIIK